MATTTTACRTSIRWWLEWSTTLGRRARGARPPKPLLQAILRRASSGSRTARARVAPRTRRLRSENLFPRGPPGLCRRRPARPQALRHLRRLLLLRRAIVPEAAEPPSSSAAGLLRSSAEPAVPRSDLRLGVDGLRHLRRRSPGVWGQPVGKGAALFGVVVAQDAADVGVVFGVAIGLAGEEGGAEVGDLGGCLCDEVGVPGTHGEWGI